MLWFAYLLATSMIAYFIYVKHTSPQRVAFFKTLASMSFVLLACWTFTLGNDQEYMEIMMIGLILGALGDFFLALPDCYPKKKDIFFLLGLISFLVGHLCYAIALFEADVKMTIVLGVGCTIIGVGFILFLKRVGVDFEKMSLPSTLYAIVILFMESLALLYFKTGFTSFTILLNIGTFAFLLSDIVLVFILFGKKETRNMIVLNWTLYYFAQMSLLSTFLVR
ncbi:MAG: lysoplasmalogenase [Longicatena sp.]